MNNDLSYFTNKEFEMQAKEILSNLSLDKNRVAEPSAYILGGQPGAGKTSLHQILGEKCDDNVININADEFRKFHPNFTEIQKEYGKDAAKHTQEFSGKMTEHVIDKLSDDKYNLIVEGTLRTSTVPLDTQKMLADKGYKTELSVIAVKPEISYVGTLLRYEDMYVAAQNPRATPKEHHDNVVKAIPENLNKIYESNKFDNITIYDRSGECLYNQQNTPEINPKDVILNTFSRAWTTKEVENLHKDINRITENMKNRNAPDIEEFKQYANDLSKKAMNTIKAKSLDIDPKEGDIILNWNKDKPIQATEINNQNKNALDNNKVEKTQNSKELHIDPKEGDILLNWGNKRHRHNKSLNEISKNDSNINEDKDINDNEKEVLKDEHQKDSVQLQQDKQEVNKNDRSKEMNKDDDFMKDYLEKQRRRSLAKGRQKDLGKER